MDVKKLVARMTLEEKAGMCSGADFWHTKAVERLGIPAVMVSDGPHGLRKQAEEGDHLGINDSIKAVCFPAGCATASSFDRDLLVQIGETLGNECQAENVGVILGPAVNIKRSPLCGRNFEYYSEDPYLASEIAASHIKGVQSKGVGTSIKHFFANNQEHRRMSSSSEMDERTAREIYLAAFEGAVRQSHPWTVMCSYNRINGVYAAENHKSETEILRDEWGFDGFVVSDWGAVNDRVPDLKAGLELEMPSSGGMNDRRIVEAVKNGELEESVLDQAVERILNIVYRFQENRDPDAVFDRGKDHEKARAAAAECMVLLKNEDGILPLEKEESVVFIGAFAKKPRYQGGGSSHINSFCTESAWEMAEEKNVIYAEGYQLKGDQMDQELLEEAVRAAKAVKTAVVFAGLPDSFESEGFDRSHMKLPTCQDALIHAVAQANPNTVVVLHNGSPVEMPWIDEVKAVLETYLGGEAVGGATVQVLYGEVNPSGHLAETFPKKLEDNPSYLYYLGEGDKTEYREGIFVGYRYYDKKKMEVLFPFGHGLSYTTFAFSNLQLDRSEMNDTDTLTVSVDVTNTGSVPGKEVVQLYVGAKGGSVIRPVRELKGFEKILLQPGETKTVTFTLGYRAFAYYDMDMDDWYVESGAYGIWVGASSRNLPEEASVQIEATKRRKIHVTMDTTFGDLMAIPGMMEVVAPMMAQVSLTSGDDDEVLGEGTADMMEAMMKYMPLRGLISFANGALGFEALEGLVQKANEIQN
ncbi:MAG: glycoside hydrolase family 3 C-terminal domain-containing protein [Fusicatenibacter sp.]|nr:glycoside hydrolase family 3 C-terminal domain-containing protein [Fusicatenibacter sp.]